MAAGAGPFTLTAAILSQIGLLCSYRFFTGVPVVPPPEATPAAVAEGIPCPAGLPCPLSYSLGFVVVYGLLCFLLGAVFAWIYTVSRGFFTGAVVGSSASLIAGAALLPHFGAPSEFHSSVNHGDVASSEDEGFVVQPRSRRPAPGRRHLPVGSVQGRARGTLA